MSKLIVLRGPSGSGKSTVAKELFQHTKKPTALIQQDHYRFIFNPAGDRHNSRTIHKLVKADILLALDDDYDVIVEGIFTMKAYRQIFEEIFAKHPDENSMFLFDISFEETLKRHQTKPDKDDFGEKDMREWYVGQDYSGYGFEVIIPEHSSRQQTVKLIRKTAGI